jgi:hypothetical protein
MKLDESTIDTIIKEQGFLLEQIADLDNKIKSLEYEINRIRIKNLLESDKPKPDTSFFKVNKIFFAEEYNYKGKNIHRFMVALENHEEPYIMDRASTNESRISSGDLIYCKIEGNKLKDVKVLYEID